MSLAMFDMCLMEPDLLPQAKDRGERSREGFCSCDEEFLLRWDVILHGAPYYKHGIRECRSSGFGEPVYRSKTDSNKPTPLLLPPWCERLPLA